MIDNKKPMIVPRLETSQPAQPTTVDLAQAILRAMAKPNSKCEQQGISTGTRDTMRRQTELRKATRYRLNSAAVIRWLGADGDIHEAFGSIHDISTCGVFVESAAAVRHAANVELEISSPTLKPSLCDLELRFEGRVIRSEKRKEREGFAVAGFLYVSRLWGRGC
jgi:PilZ domain